MTGWRRVTSCCAKPGTVEHEDMARADTEFLNRNVIA